MKVLEYIRYYSLNKLEEENTLHKNVPGHQLWNWDYLKKEGFEMSEVTPEPLTTSRLLRQLFMDNIKQQRKVIEMKDVDVVYAPFMWDAYYLALLKTLHLYRKPLVAIAQDTWDTNSCTSSLNRIKYRFLRYIAKHGVDKLLFISKSLYDQCSWYFDEKGKQIPLAHWGVDTEFYDAYKRIHIEEEKNQNIFVTGGSNRDFLVMANAALLLKDECNCKIHIQTNRCPETITPSDNLIVDRTPQDWSDLLKGYCNCLAVAVPLAEKLSFMTGITVVLEGMACRKPIISTYSPHYPFDIEKEKIGIYVPYGDATAWKDAILYFVENPDEAREMGERGRHLIDSRHNYRLFCEELKFHLSDLHSKL